MKILLISFEFPPQSGGIGTYSYQIAKQLSGLGVNVTAMVISHHVSEDEIKKFDNKQKFIIKRFKKRNNYFCTVLSRITHSVRELYSEKYELLIIAHYAAGVIGFLARILKRTPYIIVGHGTEYLMKNGIRLWVTKLIHKYAECVILNSNFTKDLLEKRKFYVKKCYVTPLGADVELYNQNNITNQNLKEQLGFKNDFVLLTVGSLSPRKNHRLVIDAVSYLSNKYHNLRYLIVGDGPMRKNLEEYIRNLDLQNRVFLQGYVNMHQLPDFYNACDLFVLTSKTDEIGDVEGFGIVFIEANLLRKAVIGSDNGGIPEAIDHMRSGIIVPTDDLNATITAIEKLYLDPHLLNNLAAYGYERALNNFTWEITAKKTLEIIRKILI